MAIICDICGADVTPDHTEDNEQEYFIIKMDGLRVCTCMNCMVAIRDWLESKDCKKYCEQYEKQFESGE